jgi:hypothetical protein
MGMGVAGLFVAFVFASPSRGEEAKDGLIGIAFDTVPEGAVVRSVYPGMGADKVDGSGVNKGGHWVFPRRAEDIAPNTCNVKWR